MTAIVIPNTFVPSTTISSTEMNANFQAVADAIEDSLALDGSTPMTGVLQLPNGSVSAPSLTFTADPNLGIYRQSSDALAFAINGLQGALFETTGATIAQSNDGATAGPIFTIDRVSASPTTSDQIGRIDWVGRNSVGGSVRYGSIESVILDATSGSEDGQLSIVGRIAGVATTQIRVHDGVQIGAPTGGYTGVNTLNIDGPLFKDGTQVVSNRVTGWTAWTGTASRATRNADAPPTLTQVAQAVKALIDDLIAHGLIGT